MKSNHQANKFWQRQFIQPGLADEVTYKLNVVVGNHTSTPSVVTIQTLDVNGDPLAIQSNLQVRLTTGVATLADSTNGLLAPLGSSGTTTIQAVTSTKNLKVQSNTAGLWSFTVTNTTENEIMGLLIGPCEGSLRGNFATAGLAYGQITGISVAPGGSHYTLPPTVIISGVNATASVITPVGNAVTAIGVATGGSGYVTAPLVTITGGSGTGATAVATINASGVVTAITPINTGSGYTGTPVATLTGGGALTTVTVPAAPAGGILATATATVSGGAVTAITLVEPGRGYASAPIVTLLGGGAVPGTSGTGAGATAIMTFAHTT